MMKAAQEFLKDAEIEYANNNYNDALMFFKLVTKFTSTAATVYPSPQALDLLWYSAFKMSEINMSLENLPESVKHGELAIRFIEDLYKKAPNDDNAQKLSGTLASLSIALYMLGKDEEANKFSIRALDIDEDLAEKEGTYEAYERIVTTLLRIARTYEKLNQEDKALEYYQHLEEVLNNILLTFEDEVEEEIKELLYIVQNKLK